MGIAQKLQRPLGRRAQHNVEIGLEHSIAIEVVVMIDVEQCLACELSVLHLADSAQRGDVFPSQAVGMLSKGFGQSVLNLIHQMGDENDTVVVAAPLVIAHDLVFILIEISSKDAHCRVVVDNRSLTGHHGILKEETGTEAMDITHEHLRRVGITKIGADTLAHTTGSPIGKRQTKHIAVGHSLGMSLTDALGKNLCLAASRWCQNEVTAMLQADDFLLVLIRCPCLLLAFHRKCF